MFASVAAALNRLFRLLLLFALVTCLWPGVSARERGAVTYFHVKTSRSKATKADDMYLPRLFRSNSGATVPMKRSQLRKARGGGLPLHQYTTSTYSQAIQTRRRVYPKAYDRNIKLETPGSPKRRPGPTPAEKAKQQALKEMESERKRRKAATMSSQQECKGSSWMWKPNQKPKGLFDSLFGRRGSAEETAEVVETEAERRRTLFRRNVMMTKSKDKDSVLEWVERGKEEEEEEKKGEEIDFNTKRRNILQRRPVIVHPLDQFCASEKSINVTGPVNRGEELLVSCLKSGKKCRGYTKEEFELIQKTLSKFDGIYFLRNDKPKCVTMNQKSCTSSYGNLESGADRLTRRDREMIRRASGSDLFRLDTPKDLTKKYKSCAVVGNAPSLSKDKFGKHIDAFDAVFRLNHVQGNNPEKKYPKRSGVKTTFRLFSKLPSFSLALGNLNVKPASKNETWLFWHDMSRYYIPGIEKSNPGVPIRMVSPYQTNWQVKIYFALRREMVRLGFGPFHCPHNINSGLHAVLLAQNFCNKIGVFGLSYEEKEASQRGHFGNRFHTMSKKHDWGFDTLVLRVLHLSKQCALCTP